MNKEQIISFNKYVNIPKVKIEKYEHNYFDDILTITLKNKKIIKISNYTLNDFEKIEYKKISNSIFNDEITREMNHSVIGVKFVIMQKHIDKLEQENKQLNNILTELEEELNIAYKELQPGELVIGQDILKNIQTIIQELKEKYK